MAHCVGIPENSAYAADELRVCQCLGENVPQLLGGVDLDQKYLTILDGFMRKILLEVDVHGTLMATDDMVAPFALSVVFIHSGVGCLRKAHVLKEVAEVYDLNNHLRGSIVFCLSSRQRDGLRHLRPPLHNSLVVPSHKTCSGSAGDTISPIRVRKSVQSCPLQCSS